MRTRRLATFAGFLNEHRLGRLLAGWLPQVRTSPIAIRLVDWALGLVVGILAAAKKPGQVAYLRRRCSWRRS